MALARVALNGERAELVDSLSRLLGAGGAPGGPIDALSSQFQAVVDILNVAASSPDGELWRDLVACQGILLAEAARLSLSSVQPPLNWFQALIEFNREIISLLNPETLVQRAVSLTYRIFGYEYIHLYLMDATGQQLTLRGALWRGQPPPPGSEDSLPVGEQSLAARAAASGEPALIAGAEEETSDKPHPTLPELRSEMAAPLKVGGLVLGVLHTGSSRARAFGESDLFLLQALADQMAIAIANARLHFNMQRRLHEQTILYGTSAAISANLDADSLLRAIAGRITEAVHAGGCAICRWDADSDALTSMVEYVVLDDRNPSRTGRPVGQSTQINQDPVARQVLRTGRPLFLQVDAGQGETLPPPAWSLPGWQTLLALPLQLEGRTMGLVELYDRRASRHFTADQVQLCQALAHQTAMAIERIRLFNETRQRLKEVSELYSLANEISTSLDVSEVLDAVVHAIRRASGCRGCCIFLLNPESQVLEIKAAAGLKAHWQEAARLRLGEGIAGRAAAEARPVYLPEVRQDPDYVTFDPEVRSLLAVPLQVKGRVIGVLNVDDRVPDAFGPDQERLLTIAAAQAAIAIENARLFSDMLSEQQCTDAVIRTMADGLLMLDAHGVVVSCNPALAMMLGMRRADILGQRAIDPAADPRLRAVCQPATVKERTGVLAHEVEIPRAASDEKKPRPRVLRIFATPVRDESGGRIGEVRVVHDVTREREVAEMREEFFSIISHELRTPLFSIQGFASLILDGQVPDQETQREFLGIIRRQAEQLAQLVSNLLNSSRLESGLLELKREPVELTEVLTAALAKLRGLAQGKGVTLQSELPPSLCPVTGDAGWLEQVITNLVGNAIKFTDKGGQVTLAAHQLDGEVLVEVKDTGMGIPADAMQHVFDKFYRVSDQAGGRPEGTGLGLHIARQVVETHGGRIWVESQVGQGSVFRFTLPGST
jgi:two-component system phosphate regulon sensor histidine kinase PhoR